MQCSFGEHHVFCAHTSPRAIVVDKNQKVVVPSWSWSSIGEDRHYTSNHNYRENHKTEA